MQVQLGTTSSEEVISVPRECALVSSVVANLLSDIESDDGPIILPNYRYDVRPWEIKTAFEYVAKYPQEAPTGFPYYDLWEEQWAASMDRSDLLLLCCFAEYIGLDRLHTVLSHIIADYDSDFTLQWRRDHPCPFYTDPEAAQQWGAKDYYRQKLARYKWWNRECEIDFTKQSARQEYIDLQNKAL